MTMNSIVMLSTYYFDRDKILNLAISTRILVSSMDNSKQAILLKSRLTQISDDILVSRLVSEI